jgi:outer membrane protein assembly factor BamB
MNIAKHKKMHNFALIALFVAILSASFVSFAGADNSGQNWISFRHDAAHTATTTDGPIYNVTMLWMYTTGAPIWSSPAVYDGQGFVGCRDGNVYCFDANNGSKLWSCQTGSLIYYSSPAIADGYCMWVLRMVT